MKKFLYVILGLLILTAMASPISAAWRDDLDPDSVALIEQRVTDRKLAKVEPTGNWQAGEALMPGDHTLYYARSLKTVDNYPWSYDESWELNWEWRTRPLKAESERTIHIEFKPGIETYSVPSIPIMDPRKEKMAHTTARNLDRYVYAYFIEPGSAPASHTSSSSLLDGSSWSTSFGELTLSEVNGVITGRYTYDNGVIQKVRQDGYVLTGEWVETPSTGEKRVGRFSWTFDELFSSYTGTWGYGESATDGGDWEGSLIIPVTQVPTPTQQQTQKAAHTLCIEACEEMHGKWTPDRKQGSDLCKCINSCGMEC